MKLIIEIVTDGAAFGDGADPFVRDAEVARILCDLADRLDDRKPLAVIDVNGNTCGRAEWVEGGTGTKEGMWVIECVDDYGPLYWSNLDGWTGLGDADTFSETERRTLRLPFGGEWVYLAPPKTDRPQS